MRHSIRERYENVCMYVCMYVNLGTKASCMSMRERYENVCVRVCMYVCMYVCDITNVTESDSEDIA